MFGDLYKVFVILNDFCVCIYDGLDLVVKYKGIYLYLIFIYSLLKLLFFFIFLRGIFVIELI